MHDRNTPEPPTSPLALAGHPADWQRVATALTSGGRPVLSNVVRDGLAAARHAAPAGRVALSFAPAHATAIQRVASSLGLRLAAASLAD